jgi:hypothetical protein
MYNKAKEVIDNGCKGFFFELWHQKNLISYYDKWCYEYAYQCKNRNSTDKARLLFYMQHGTNETIIHQYTQALNNPGTTYREFQQLANMHTPKLTAIMNIEYETKRNFYRNSDNWIDTNLSPVNRADMPPQLERLYSIIDNRCVFVEYLTRVTVSFRKDNRPLKLRKLAEKMKDKIMQKCTDKAQVEDCEIDFTEYDEAEELDRPVDDNEYEPFWRMLRSTKLQDNPTPLKLVREYGKTINHLAAAKRLITAVSTNGAYNAAKKGLTEEQLKAKDYNEHLDEYHEYLCNINDNDLNRLFANFKTITITKFRRIKNRAFKDEIEPNDTVPVSIGEPTADNTIQTEINILANRADLHFDKTDENR